MDVDFIQDIRIRKLVKYQGGRAIAVYALLLCFIYRNGYYAVWDKELPFIISEQTGFDEAYIQQVLKSCLNIGLLCKELFESDNILTSKGIQLRYSQICAASRRRDAIDAYCLIPPEEKPQDPPAPTWNATPPPPRQRRPKAATPTPRSKAPTPTPGLVHPEAAVPAAPQAPCSAPAPPPQSVQPYSATIDDEVAAMRSPSPWKESVCTRYRLTDTQVDDALADFALKCDKRHTSMQDARSHFCYWLQKHLASTRPSPPAKRPAASTRKKASSPTPPVDSAAELRDYMASRGLDPGTTDLSKVAVADSAADFDAIPH